jgi:ABC-2 family transporter protein
MVMLVYEKEAGLRMMMKMHGLGDAAYWLVTYTWYLMLYVIYIIVFMAFGSIIGLQLFLRNSFGEQLHC